MNKLLIFSVLLITFSFFSCSGGKEKQDKETELKSANSLGLVDADVESDKDLLGDMPSYDSKAPGQAETIERSFENAPPLIPHSTEGLVPITKDNNMCLSCHMPEVAPAMKSTPIPPSHMTDYRPPVKESAAGGDKDLVVAKDLKGKLNMARYNCTQCHVPQAKVDVAVQNTFKAVFRDNKLKKGSNLNKTMDEGVK